MRRWQRRFILRAYALEMTEGDKEFFRVMESLTKNKAIVANVGNLEAP